MLQKLNLLLISILLLLGAGAGGYRLMDDGYTDLATFQADGSISTRANLIANLDLDAYELVARRPAST